MNTPQPVTPLSSLSFIHAAPAGPDVNVLLDNVQLNGSAFHYTNVSGYLPVNSGSINIKFTPVSGSNALIDTTFTVLENKVYSVFVINRQSAIKPLVTQDEGVLKSNFNIRIRFVHLSPDTPSVYVVVVGEATALFPAQDFQQVSSFTEVSAKTYAFEVRAVSDNHLVASTTLTSLAGPAIQSF